VKILFFSYAYPNAAAPQLGTFNRSLLAALASEHVVRVVSPVSFIEGLRGRWRGRSAFDPAFQAIRGVTADYVPFYYPPKILHERFGDFLWWSAGRKLVDAVRTFRPDAILSYWAHPDGDVAARAARMCGVPVAAMVGGSDVLLLARSGRRREAILRALRNSDAVIAVSRHIAQTLEEDGIDAEKIHVVRRGIDRSRFSPGDRSEARRALGIDPGRFTMISVGRLAPVKGHRHLVRACAELRGEGGRFSCYILGDGPLRCQLEREVRACGLEREVVLAGARPQAELAQWYRAADVTVLPSLSEGVPNVLLESISCGTPFVASDVGGIPEIADERFDDLVPRENATALALVLRRRMGKGADCDSRRRRFVPFGWDDSAHALCGVLRRITGQGGDEIDRQQEASAEPVVCRYGR
jgi:glycosyltransferase involved in cell wall biosynthesis